MMIGKNLGLNRSFCLLFICFLGFEIVHAQEANGPEKRAVIYFCTQVAKAERGLTDFNIRFKGSTTGKPSRVYKIADCIGDISLIKDSIPNRTQLDSLENFYEENTYKIIPIDIPVECKFLKRRVFSPFNNRIYTLQVFNTIDYKGDHFVELYLSNRKLNTWIFCVRFSKNGEVIGHCKSFVVY